jgi:hypothetical protein
LESDLAHLASGGSVNTNRSWFSLLTFCASASLAAALALAMVFAGASAVLAAATPAAAAAEETNSAPQTTFAGVITDSQCGARHAEGSGKSPAECTLACVKSGAKFALVNGDKVYKLEGNANDLSRWAGQRVKIVGARSGDTITVTSVAAPS